jgi:hypothetical protein
MASKQQEYARPFISIDVMLNSRVYSGRSTMRVSVTLSSLPEEV